MRLEVEQARASQEHGRKAVVEAVAAVETAAAAAEAAAATAAETAAAAPAAEAATASCTPLPSRAYAEPARHPASSTGGTWRHAPPQAK